MEIDYIDKSFPQELNDLASIYSSFKECVYMDKFNCDYPNLRFYYTDIRQILFKDKNSLFGKMFNLLEILNSYLPSISKNNFLILKSLPNIIKQIVKELKFYKN